MTFLWDTYLRLEALIATFLAIRVGAYSRLGAYLNKYSIYIGIYNSTNEDKYTLHSSSKI